MSDCPINITSVSNSCDCQCTSKLPLSVRLQCPDVTAQHCSGSHVSGHILILQAALPLLAKRKPFRHHLSSFQLEPGQQRSFYQINPCLNTVSRLRWPLRVDMDFLAKLLDYHVLSLDAAGRMMACLRCPNYLEDTHHKRDLTIPANNCNTQHNTTYLCDCLD